MAPHFPHPPVGGGNGCGEWGDGPKSDEMGIRAAAVALARRHGFSLADAERIADQLRQRDRLLLDMAMCIECSRLEGRRCGAARVGQMTSASRQFEPVRAELIRCEHFKPNPRTTP